jgi:tetratricopeptide (TPR) repeat protein
MLVLAEPAGRCEIDARKLERREGIWGMRAMKISGMKFVAVVVAGFLGLVGYAPTRAFAQAGATIHGHVQNAAGQPIVQGEVRLTTDKNPSAANAKFEYTFPLDANGNYKGTVDKPGNYIAGVFVQGHSVDFMPTQIAGSEDKTVDFDMTRQAYIDKMSPADREALAEFKKKNAETVQENSKIGNLNKLLTDSRTAMSAGNYDVAVKNMTDATTAKPDEGILWDTLGDAQLGQANAAAKAAHVAKATDASLPDKYNAAIASYQKAITLNAAVAKPDAKLVAAANNQMGEAFGKLGKTKDAAAAYAAAATADPHGAGMYYYNEAATLFNGNDMEGAAAAADKAIAADPTKVEAYYIKGQALVQQATVDPKTQKITAPPECIAAYQKYLELAPTGPHAEEIKGILAGIGAEVKDTYKAPKKR